MKNCYIAAGWFNPELLKDLTDIKEVLDELGLTYYSPKDEQGDLTKETAQSIFCEDVDQIENCEFMVVSVKDVGAVWEAGYGFAHLKPIIYYWTSKETLNMMIEKSGQAVATTREELKEYISGIHKNKYFYKSFKGNIH
jgi:nucleoside 2-deoxyribosyltransferase